MSKDDDIIWIASVDPGKKNFAFYIEEFNKNTILALPFIPKTQRYNINGSPSEKFSEIIEKVCINGKKILFKVVDLTSGCDKKTYLDTETFHNLTDILDEYTTYWDRCNGFIIEKQMSNGKQHNTMALKIAQHCWSYFSFRYSRFKPILEFPAYHKTQILGAEKIQKKLKSGKITYKAMDKPARKKWSIEKAIKILSDRLDNTTLSELTSIKKKDDLADVLCQLQAFKIIYIY